jgi:ribosomal protein RSM22 (predicted rRNA methylase)
MPIPPPLAIAIEDLASGVRPPELARACAELTEGYRERGDGTVGAFGSELHLVAYCVARLPATYAACETVFARMAAGMKDAEEAGSLSLLDLGAGPGTAAWAAAEILGGALGGITLVERDVTLIEIGRRLAADGPASIRNARWRNADLVALPEDLPPHDIVCLSYSLNELAPPVRERVMATAFRLARRAVVLVEPGTPAGFASLLAARDQLIREGGHVLAPCPHNRPCPMPELGSWCHFAERLQRTRRHRAAKGAELGWEDEKYGYMIIGREAPAPGGGGRIVYPPSENKVQVTLDLCTSDGLVSVAIPRRERDGYKRAKKARWGDWWDSERFDKE